MPDEFVTSKAVLTACPGLNASTLSLWGNKCPHLGRPVATKPDPRRPSWRLYKLADVLAAVEHQRQHANRPKLTLAEAAAAGLYITFGEVRAAYPRLRFHRLNAWRNECTLIGRPVATQPDTRNPGCKRYSAADVQAACERIEDGPLPDVYEDADETWLLVEHVRAADRADTRAARARRGWPGPYRIGLSNLHKWVHSPHGCPALAGRRLLIRWRSAWGLRSARVYVRVRDLDDIVAARRERASDPIPVGWVGRASAIKSVGLGFLVRYAGLPHPRRKHVIEAHPAIGRPVRTAPRRVYDNRGLVRRVPIYWAADLQAVLTTAPPPETWVTRAEAMRDYQLTDHDLNAAVRLKTVEAVPFPRPPRVGQRAEPLHYRRAGLKAFIDRRKARNARPRPKWLDDARCRLVDGEPFWPHRETCYFAGIEAFQLTRFRAVGCPHLDGGRKIKAEQIDAGWKQSKPLVWFYFKADADLIWQTRHGTKGRRRSKPTGRKRGREEKSNPAELAKLYADWKASGLTMKAFAPTVGLTYAELRAKLNAYHARQSAKPVPANRAGRGCQA